MTHKWPHLIPIYYHVKSHTTAEQKYTYTKKGTLSLLLSSVKMVNLQPSSVTETEVHGGLTGVETIGRISSHVIPISVINRIFTTL